MPEKDDKAAKAPKFKCFGVYQLDTGSYTLGETRFVPFKGVGCNEETKASACEDSSPVKFFDTLEAANENAGKLKAKVDAKRNPKPQEN